MTFDNYECDVQMSVFDFLHSNESAKQDLSIKPGEYVESHGERVFFDQIKENQCYIADCSTQHHKWYKIIYVKWKRDDSIGYVDSEKGIKGKWSWGNTYSALTRKMYIDTEYKQHLQEAATSGWWYKISEEGGS